MVNGESRNTEYILHESIVERLPIYPNVLYFYSFSLLEHQEDRFSRGLYCMVKWKWKRVSHKSSSWSGVCKSEEKHLACKHKLCRLKKWNKTLVETFQ